MRHLIDFGDLPRQEWDSLYHRASEIIDAPEKFIDVCRGKVSSNLFYEPSTRTNFSFQTAMLRLGGSVFGFADPNSSSVSKGETLKDTIKIVSNYADVIVMRTPWEGAAKAASLYANVPVVNAGDGGHMHPTQTMADLTTITRLRGKVDDLSIGLCGDLKNGRTVHSLIKALAKFQNITFFLISPRELAVPDYVRTFMRENNMRFTEVTGLEAVMPQLDVLYMPRIQKERFVDPVEYERNKGIYVLTRRKLDRAKPDMLSLHPLPRVDEITVDVDDDPRAVYFQQARFGMYAHMALREHLAALDPDMAEKLFGSQKQSGRLIVSDGVFDADAQCQTRSRLRIDRATRTAAAGGKFDVAHLAADSRFSFTLTWLGLTRDEGELRAVEGLLAALHSGQIRLGGQKSGGFGRVSLPVCRRCFDLTDPADRTAWLADQPATELLTLPKETGGGRVTFVLTGRADSLLVRSGAPLETEKRRGAYTPNLTENGRPVLPGSSIKGAVRARAEQIAAALGLSKGRTEALFGRGAGAEDNGRPGQGFFEDGVITQPQKKQISRIRINRFTGGVIRGGLFTEEPLRCDLELRISAPDAPADCGLLLYALRDLGAGLYNLGSGGAIGRGYVQVDRLTATLSDGRRASLTFDRERRCTAEDPEEIFKRWLSALEEERT